MRSEWFRNLSKRSQRTVLRTWSISVALLLATLHDLAPRYDVYWVIACITSAAALLYGFMLSFSSQFADE